MSGHGGLGRKISDEDFNRAYTDAKRKQTFLSDLGYRHVTEEGYLLELVCEYVARNSLSDLTVEISRMLNNMEKEHSFRRTERPKDTPIVAVSAK